jgi:hypothetical protein
VHIDQIMYLNYFSLMNDKMVKVDRSLPVINKIYKERKKEKKNLYKCFFYPSWELKRK